MARILVVEDDPMLLEFYTELLKAEGFSVDQAPDGEVAFQSAFEGGYDLVLLDVNLPKKNGVEILEALSKTPPKAANKKIVMLTNANEPIVEEKVKAYGVTALLLKSALTPDQLIIEVKTFLA